MSSSPRALSSWKEIAHYLGINVRTAQKWERERGLPVRRVPGARSRVSAETVAINSWKEHLAAMGPSSERCYTWPLGPGITAEVRFCGQDVGPAHIDLLREYLDLVKRALSRQPVR
jgi:excisionase family DNA binding protein